MSEKGMQMSHGELQRPLRQVTVGCQILWEPWREMPQSGSSFSLAGLIMQLHGGKRGHRGGEAETNAPELIVTIVGFVCVGWGWGG